MNLRSSMRTKVGKVTYKTNLVMMFTHLLILQQRSPSPFDLRIISTGSVGFDESEHI